MPSGASVVFNAMLDVDLNLLVALDALLAEGVWRGRRDGSG